MTPHFANDTFVRELSLGHLWQRHVANFLRLQGLDVTCSPLSVRPSYEERHGYSDCDMEVCGALVEVKSRRLRFTGLHDLPASCLPLFVDEVPNFGKKDPAPSAYIIVSTVTGAMIVAPVAPTRWWSSRSTPMAASAAGSPTAKAWTRRPAEPSARPYARSTTSTWRSSVELAALLQLLLQQLKKPVGQGAVLAGRRLLSRLLQLDRDPQMKPLVGWKLCCTCTHFFP